MAYRGLFVGVDRYASEDISELSCAVRDASALHAVFEDTVGAGGTLLTDGAATLSALRTELDALEQASAEDVVVIFFSGHGAPTHHLVANDTSPDDLAGSGLSLDELTERFHRIPADRLVCVLDCCFSGGMGAKVLMPGAVPRDLRSTESLLNGLSGRGRVILTASSATEPAWEDAALGHGYLTHHLLRTLLGEGRGATGEDTIRLFSLLELVTREVEASARSIGTAQHPTVRGTFEGDVVWPVFRRGAAYTARFPDWGAARATDNLTSLRGLGFPDDLIGTWAGAIPALNRLQVAAINDHGVLDGRNVLVSAPTSSGKTMVGELAALRAAVERRRSVFLLPMRALVNDKYEAFTRLYAGFGIRTIRATGEIEDDMPALVRGHYDIALMTNEKFAAVALSMPHVLDGVGLIVLDEAQLIADPGRGQVLEFLLTMLRIRARTGAAPQLVLLSAVIGGANHLDTWLDASLLATTARPVPLEEGVLRSNGDFRYLDTDGAEAVEAAFIRPAYRTGGFQDYVIPLVKRLVDAGEQVIVFRETRGEARGTARYLAQSLGLPPAEQAMQLLPAGDLSQASRDLRDALAGGVAFHVSDLDREERAVVEAEYRRASSGLRVIAATTTLAMGVNTPASSVVIAGLEHPGPNRTAVPYAVAEYKNMVGRAGRLGFAEKGRSFLIAPNSLSEHGYWAHYVTGTPEVIVSRLPVTRGEPASIITRVLAAAEANAEGSGMAADDVIDFLAASYAAHLETVADADWQLDRPRFERSLSDLAHAGLLEADDEGRYRLTPLGRVAGRTGTEVQSVIRLANGLRPCAPEAINAATLIAATQATVELDQTRVPLNRRSTTMEPGQWWPYLGRNGVCGPVVQALRHGPDAAAATMRAKRAGACLLYMSATPMDTIERHLTAHVPGRDAAGDLRSVVSRTLDLLPTTLEVARIVHPDLPVAAEADDILTRLQLGLPAEAVPLGRLAAAGLPRHAYLALAARGLIGLDALDAASDEELEEALGSAASVKVVRAAVARRPAELPEMPSLDG